MIRLYDFDEVRPEEILNRDIRAEADVEATVDAIIADVRARGDDALIEYAAKFDHAELTDVRVSQAEIEEAFAELEKTDPEFITTLKMAAENIRHFHEQQLHKNFVVNDKPGIVLGQKYTPIQRAGVYVPGGTAAYPSTVLMDVIPAKVAGVKQIVMTTPAGRDGKVNPAILASVDTNGKIIVTDDMNKAVEAVNIIAPEHLEICVDDPFAVLNSVQNAGSIFLGKNVPEALGDYFAGPNHTLPTSGTARFSSPLGVDDFVKKSSFIYYTREALGEVQGRIANFAEHEGLHAHARSVTIRFEE